MKNIRNIDNELYNKLIFKLKKKNINNRNTIQKKLALKKRKFYNIMWKKNNSNIIRKKLIEKRKINDFLSTSIKAKNKNSNYKKYKNKNSEKFYNFKNIKTDLSDYSQTNSTINSAKNLNIKTKSLRYNIWLDSEEKSLFLFNWQKIEREREFAKIIRIESLL